MSSTDKGIEPVTAAAAPAATPAIATGLAWGNSAPLALSGFAVTTFMLSMVNANLVPVGVTAVVFGVALMFGGLVQLISGVIQLRTGNTFGGMLFCGFGAFWLSLFAFAQFFLRAVPLTQVGHALGLFLYGFGIFSAIMLAASFRTSITVVVALLLLTATLFVLAAGNYGASSGLVKTGGWMGLAVAAFAFYLSLAEICEATYGREVLPVGHLARS
jgi:uncharacterized protein